MVHMEIDMDTAPDLSAQIRSIVAAALSESGMGLRRLEATRSLPAWSLRGIMDPSREQSPSVDRAAEILAALGYELVIRPREPVSGPAPDRPGSVSRPRETDLDPSGPPPGSVSRPRETDPDPPAPPSAVASEPVADRHVAELLAAIADEYEALNGDGRASLLTRIWGLHPELRERAAARSGPRLARLAGGTGAG